MIIKNGMIYSDQNAFVPLDIITANDTIQQLSINEDGAQRYDLTIR